MKLIFIRHAEPDYQMKTLTEKGFRESEYLAERVRKWDVDRFYVSPLARARLTIAPALSRMGRTAVEKDWMREFSYPVTIPETGETKHVPWDFLPEYWTKEPLFFDKDRWHEHPVFRTNPDYEREYPRVFSGIDEILAEYGYHRDGGCYRCDRALTDFDDDKLVVIVSHLGVSCMMMGHLLGISPVLMQQSFFLPPTSVTVLQAEKRDPAFAMFRIQVAGCTRHLAEHGEPISYFASFAGTFDQ